MRNEAREPLTRSKRLLLAGSTAAALAVPVGAGIARAGRPCAGDARATAGGIRGGVGEAEHIGEQGGMFGPQPGGRFVALNAPVSYLIASPTSRRHGIATWTRSR